MEDLIVKHLLSKKDMWCEVTKEEIENAMLMPGEYVKKDGKFYVRPGMLDGYVVNKLLEEGGKINDKGN